MYPLIYTKSFWKIREYIAIHKQLANKINWKIYLNVSLFPSSVKYTRGV